MADHSAIEWTDATWNPTTGCTKISPGCAHCYIERTPAFRIKGRHFVNGHIPLQLHADRLEQPLHWKRPRRVFVNSLSDLFHEDVPDAFILSVFNVMRRSDVFSLGHTFQLLTKRAERMRSFCSRLQFDHRGAGRLFLEDRGLTRQGHAISLMPLLKHVWLGVSVENQHFADERIPLLVQTPAAVRFISAEPLLGPLELAWEGYGPCEYGYLRQGIHWVIVGGESGPRSRDCRVEWVRAIRWQCREAHVPCFVKQLGRQPRVSDGVYLNLRDKKGGDPTEWPADLRVREFPVPRGTSQTSRMSQT